jgi:hypothetical protein
MGVFGIHFSPLDSLDNEGRGIDCTVAALRCRLEPVIVLGRHQHEFAPAVTGDFHGLAPRLVLEFPDFPLEFKGGGLGHSGPTKDYPNNTYYTENVKSRCLPALLQLDPGLRFALFCFVRTTRLGPPGINTFGPTPNFDFLALGEFPSGADSRAIAEMNFLAH